MEVKTNETEAKPKRRGRRPGRPAKTAKKVAKKKAVKKVGRKKKVTKRRFSKAETQLVGQILGMGNVTISELHADANVAVLVLKGSV